MTELLSDPSTWVALLSLTALEIVLGIDNIVFIAILTDRLPEEKRGIAYRLGLGGALITRIMLLFSISWLTQLTNPLLPDWTPIFLEWEAQVTGKDLVLLIGGIFLIGKSAHEIFAKVEDTEDDGVENRKVSSLASIVAQIAILDIVFSLDSVITAVGVAEHIEVMVAAVVIAMIIMLIFAKTIGDFVNKNPSMKVLALAFLLLIGVLLTADAFGQHIDKAYIYFAMGFALAVELINMRLRKRKRQKRATS